MTIPPPADYWSPLATELISHEMLEPKRVGRMKALRRLYGQYSQRSQMPAPRETNRTTMFCADRGPRCPLDAPHASSRLASPRWSRNRRAAPIGCMRSSGMAPPLRLLPRPATRWIGHPTSPLRRELTCDQGRDAKARRRVPRSDESGASKHLRPVGVPGDRRNLGEVSPLAYRMPRSTVRSLIPTRPTRPRGGRTRDAPTLRGHCYGFLTPVIVAVVNATIRKAGKPPAEPVQ